MLGVVMRAGGASCQARETKGQDGRGQKVFHGTCSIDLVVLVQVQVRDGSAYIACEGTCARTVACAMGNAVCSAEIRSEGEEGLAAE